jgi:hypothetical protein
MMIQMLPESNDDDLFEGHDEIVEKARAANRALNFLQTVAANLDNEALTDEQFRDFMRRSMVDMPGVNHGK